jgi:protein involved in polysaccharide export with SLBB domain
MASCQSPFCVVAVLLVVAGWALAQPATLQAPVFNYYVWGQVSHPGAYNLGASPDIVELLSAAGGPSEYADMRHVVLIRATTQQHVEINMKKMLFSGQVISLSPGDVVLVPNSAWYSVQQYLSVTTTLVSVATLIFTIMTWVAR